MNRSGATVPVAPDSVRVFRGFRLASISHQDFLDRLGSVFMPATVQIQVYNGLTAYMPSVLPSDHHTAAPDEIALVFYERREAYDEAKLTVGGRVYSDIHGLVFDLERSLSGFPDKFEGTVAVHGRYYLFDEHVDWQRGAVCVYVGVRGGVPVPSFLERVAERLTAMQRNRGPDGVIAATSSEYIVCWAHWPAEARPEPSGLGGLEVAARTVYHEWIPSFELSVGLWERFEGLRLNGGESFNFGFARDRTEAHA